MPGGCLRRCLTNTAFPRQCCCSIAKGTATAKSDLDLLVQSELKGLKFVGLIEAVREAAGMPVDVFDVSHIERGSLIDREIQATGVTIYEK